MPENYAGIWQEPQVTADQVCTVLQVMIHKAGKGWNERCFFRPITLCNDLFKVLDGCLYYMMARETGTIEEPAPGQTTVRFREEVRRMELHCAQRRTPHGGVVTRYCTASYPDRGRKEYTGQRPIQPRIDLDYPTIRSVGTLL